MFLQTNRDYTYSYRQYNIRIGGSEFPPVNLSIGVLFTYLRLNIKNRGSERTTRISLNRGLTVEI